MTIETPWNDAPRLEMGLSDELLFFSVKEINATMIDPKTGARLEPIAIKLRAEIRRTQDDQLAIITRKGLDLESELGTAAFGEMLQHMRQAMTGLVEQIVPPALVHDLRVASYDEDNLKKVSDHAEKAIKAAKRGCNVAGGEITLLDIGGQSMAVRFSYRVPTGTKPIELVGKYLSPLAQAGLRSRSIPIMSPMTSELLRREVCIQDPDFQAAAATHRFAISGALIATPQLMIEEYYEGIQPNTHNSRDFEQITKFVTAVGDVIDHYYDPFQEPGLSETARLMQGIISLDVKAVDHEKAPELWPLKTNNFIRTRDGLLVCIDPFIPEPLDPQREQIDPNLHKLNGYTSPETTELYLRPDRNPTTPFSRSHRHSID